MGIFVGAVKSCVSHCICVFNLFAFLHQRDVDCMDMYVDLCVDFSKSSMLITDNIIGSNKV